MHATIHKERSFLSARTVILMLGLASFWAYFESIFFGADSMRDYSSGSALPFASQCIGCLSSGAVSALAALKTEFMERTLVRKGAFEALSVASSLAAIAIVVPPVRNAPFALYAVLAIGGIASSFVMFFWLRMFSHEDRDKRRVSAGMLVAGSLALSGALVIPISALQPRFVPVAIALLPLLGIGLRALFRTAQRNREKAAQATAAFRPWAPFSTDPFVERFGITRRLFLSIVVFSIATAMLQPLYFVDAGSEAFGSIFAYQISRYGTAFVVLVGALLFTVKPYVVFRLGMLFVIGSYMLTPFLSEGWRFFGVVVTNGGYTCLELMVWTVLFESARLRGANALRIVGIGRFVVMMASFCGLALSAIFGKTLLTTDSDTAFLTFIAFILVIALVVVLDESKSVSAWYLVESSLASHDNQDTLSLRCAALADEKGLTQRERDVLDLLAAGRSANYIAQELGIASSTVNYHIRHIYEKCGVNSKQDLIDAVRND